MNLVDVGNRITIARKRAGYSQKQLATIIGVAPSTFTGYEKGKADPKSDGLMAIAEACNVTVDYLLCRTNEPEVRSRVVYVTTEEAQVLANYRNAPEPIKKLITEVLNQYVPPQN